MAMLSVAEIKRAIEQLSPEALESFRIWFAERDAAEWDRQFEDDVTAGRLNALAKHGSQARAVMAQERMAPRLWDQLVAEELSGITFVRDYLQLQFNPPPQLNVYSARVTVSANGRTSAFGDESFANNILSLIGRLVREVTVEEGRSFNIVFVDGSHIQISLRREDYEGPEAIEFQGRDNQWVVI